MEAFSIESCIAHSEELVKELYGYVSQQASESDAYSMERAIYQKLMQLRGRQFWLMSAEMRREKPNPEIEREAERLRWEIADELRKLIEARQPPLPDLKARWEALQAQREQSHVKPGS